MNKHKNILILFALVLFVSACIRKNPANETYTIKGQLLYNCSGSPVSNTELDILSKSSLLSNGFSVYSTTDSNGNFSISYSRGGGTPILFSANSKAIVSDIPLNEDINLGIIYYVPTCNYVVRIMVNNPYLTADSLVIYRLNNLGPGGVYFPTPLSFTDTLININDFYSISTPTYLYKNKVSVRIGYNLYKPDHTVDHYFFYDTLLTACKWPPDTLLLVVN